MTVAVGFVFDEGYLFCVDTKVSTTIKTNESKIVHYRYADGACATTFAISSDDLNFPRSACESCYEAVNKINFATATIESVRKAIQSALGKFYKEHIFPHPDRSAGNLYLEMLVGIWLKHETRVFLSHETLLNPIERYDCIGTGAYLAKYLIRQYLCSLQTPDHDLTFEDAAIIASFAVESAIDYDEYCGGEAETIIIKNSGEVNETCDVLLYPGDSFIKSFHQEGWNLVRDLVRIKNDRETESDFVLEDYFERIRKMQRSYLWAIKLLEDKSGI